MSLINIVIEIICMVYVLHENVCSHVIHVPDKHCDRAILYIHMVHVHVLVLHVNVCSHVSVCVYMHYIKFQPEIKAVI